MKTSFPYINCHKHICYIFVWLICLLFALASEFSNPSNQVFSSIVQSQVRREELIPSERQFVFKAPEEVYIKYVFYHFREKNVYFFLHTNA